MLRIIGPATLACDPQLQQIDDTAVCKLFVFIKDLKRVKGGREDHPIPYEVWGNAGRAAAEHLTQGSRVLLDGSLNYEEWTASNGEKRSRFYGSGNVDFLAIKPAREDIEF